MLNSNRIKILAVLLTVFGSAALFGWLIKGSIVRPRATGEVVNMDFLPQTNTFQVEQPQTITIIIQTTDTTKKISGLDITFKAEDKAQITDIGIPVPIDGPSGGSPTFYSQLTKQVSSTQSRISAINQSSDDQQLPHAVRVNLTFKGGAVGTGKITVSSTATQIVGNIASRVYALGTIDEGNYNFISPPALMTYSLKKTVVPPVIDGSLSEFGQAQSVTFGGPTNNSVIVKGFWDDSNLYLGYIVRDYQLNFLATQRDGAVWQDDAVEWFIDTQNDGGGSQTPNEPYMLPDDYQGIINVNNTQFDTQGSVSGAPQISWNGQWQSAVLKGGTVNTNDDTDSAYTVEVKIPWSSVGLQTAPTAGTIFGMSFAVDDQDANTTISAMWPNITTAFQNASKWQKAQLLGPPPTPTVTLTPSSTPSPSSTSSPTSGASVIPPSPYTTAFIAPPTATPIPTPTDYIVPTSLPTHTPTIAPSLIGNSIPTIPSVLTFVIRSFFVVAGLGALTYLSLGAYSWITSGGNPELLEKAQAKMVAAVVGLVLVVGVVSAVTVFEQLVFSQKICFGISCPLQLPSLIQ